MEFIQWKTGDTVLKNRYILLKNITGGQGVFWTAWDNHENKLVGLKVVDIYTNFQEKDEFSKELVKVAKETYISLLVPEHPNLMRFYNSIIDENTYEIINIVEYIPGITLFDEYSNTSLNNRVAEKIHFVLQIVESLLFLTNHFDGYSDIIKLPGGDPKGFYHGDLHSENIIITPDRRAVLIDWGQSYRYITRSKIFPAVSPDFHPKSIFSGYRGSAIDVFSIGVLLWNLLLGKIPYGNGNYRHSKHIDIDIVNNGTLNNHEYNAADVSNDLISLIHQMVSCNPDIRPSLSNVIIVLEHELDKFNAVEKKTKHLYFLRNTTMSRERVIGITMALLSISRIIDTSHDPRLKAQLFELSIRFAGQQSAYFSEKDIPLLDSLMREYSSYLQLAKLKKHTTKSYEYYKKQFTSITQKDHDSIIIKIQKLLHQHMQHERVSSTIKKYLHIHEISHFRHYMFAFLIEASALFIVNNPAYEKTIIELIMNIHSHLEILLDDIDDLNHKNDRINELNFTFTYYYHYYIENLEGEEYLDNRIKKNKININVIILQQKILSNLFENILSRGTYHEHIHKDTIIMLIKIIEWGYTWSRYISSSSHLYFMSTFNKQFGSFLENISSIPASVKTYQLWTQMMSFIVYSIIADINHGNVEISTYESLLNSFDSLLGISYKTHILMELLDDFDLLLSTALNAQQNNNSFNPILSLLCDRIGSAFNNSFIRIYSIISDEKKEYSDIPFDFIFMLSQTKTLQEYLEMVESSKLNEKVKRSLAYYRGYMREQLEHFSPPDVNRSLFEEEKEQIKIGSLIEDGKIDQALKLIIDSMSIKLNTDAINVKRILMLYYYLLKIIEKQERYFDLVALVRDVMLHGMPHLESHLSGEIERMFFLGRSKILTLQ